MRSLSGLGIGLSLVFGCLFLALIAEVYYLLWWKKKVPNRDGEDHYSSSARELIGLFCWKKPSSLTSTALNPHEICTTARITDESDDVRLKPFGTEDGMDTELMRLHHLSGPTRILFTIKEETKEDLESEDGKSRGRSLSDVLVAVETPFQTPLSSPSMFTPPLTPMNCYNQHGFNPLFESSKEEEKKWIRASPPPKFKFLRDAEEKLYRKTLMEEAQKVRSCGVIDHGNMVGKEVPSVASPPKRTTGSEEDGSFIIINVGKSHSSSSQVIPLPSPPPINGHTNGKTATI